MTVATKAPPVEHPYKPKAEYCYHCGMLLVVDGYLRYHSEMRPGASFPTSVKVCYRCKDKWIQGEDDVDIRVHGR